MSQHRFDGYAVSLFLYINVTRQKQNEAELIEAREAAEVANLTKSEFLATISHELRTPLTSIRGFLQTVLSDSEMPISVREELLNIVHHQSLRLSSLVDDLLDLTSLEIGKSRFNDEPLDLRQIANNCFLALQPLASQKDLTLEARLQDSIPTFLGDAIRLQSVFTNLLSNAVKFTPKGGAVSVMLDASEDSIRFAVQDTGPGIPANQRQKIFEKFHRVYHPSRLEAGTGLGIPIVNAIVEHYGGRVEVHSEEGRGSCFEAYLPLRRSESRQSEALSSEL